MVVRKLSVGLASCAVLLIAPDCGATRVSKAGLIPDARSGATIDRIVSFAPSNTELLYALGVQQKLQGVCSFCDYPVDARRLEKTGTFVSANLERLTRMKPQKILLVSGQEPLASVLKHNRFDVQLLKNEKLSDISRNIVELGTLTDARDSAAELSVAFRKCISDLHAILNTSSKQPKVFYCVWPEPLLTVGSGSFLHDVITECGGINIAGGAKSAYPHFSAEKLILSNPDVIILPYEAMGKISLKRAPWSSLRAVKDGRAYFLPEPEKNGLIRPTLRIVNGLSWLCERLHPEKTNQIHGWLAASQRSLRLR